MVEDVVAIADALGLGRFGVWGVSGGGPHALACAALLSSRVPAAASLAAVAPYDAPGLDWTEGMGEDNIVEFNATLEGREAITPYELAHREAFADATPDDLRTQWASLLTPVDAAVATAAIRTSRLKFDNGFWRPYQAINDVRDDGNPDTTPQPGWAPLVTNPSYSDYTSGHASATAPFAEVMRHHFGDEAQLVALLGRDATPGQHHAHRLLERDHAR